MNWTTDRSCERANVRNDAQFEKDLSEPIIFTAKQEVERKIRPVFNILKDL
jgi:hypothetical protein